MEEVSLPVRFTSIEAVRAALGATIGPSPTLIVEQPIVDDFARITGDHEWIHVDKARAAAGPFGGTIAHGYLTLALVAGFAARLFRLDFGDATVNYGVDRVRFPAPLRVGAAVHATATFTEIAQHPAGHRIRVEYRLTAGDSQTTVCVAEALLLVKEDLR